MAIASIYIILLFAISIAYLGFWKEDYWLILLSSFIFVFIGLTTISSGFEDITAFSQRWVFGILFTFIGVYMGSRGGIEALKEGI